MTELVLATGARAFGLLRRADAVWLLVLAIPLALAVLVPQDVGRVLAIASAALVGTAPYIVVAVGLIGGLKASGAEGVLAQAFKGREHRMIVLAALAGGLAPFCSCEVIPFVAALIAAGTPLSAVMAFWLSSPLMDPPQFFITSAALGWDFAAAKVIFAVALGIAGGYGVRVLATTGALEAPLKARKGCGGCGARLAEGPVAWRFWQAPARRAAFRAAVLENTLFLIKWLSLAYLLEALLILYMPAELIASAVGGEGVWPVVVGALVGAPAYLNGYAAPALVAGLMDTGMSAGAAMAFMIAGAVSSIPAMAAVFALVRAPVFAAYLGLGIGGAILSGLIFGAVVG